MPWFTYNKSGGEGDFWDTAYWNYVNLSKKYTEELLPALYFSKQDGGDLGDAFTETPEIYDKKYGNFEALGQVRRTSDLSYITDRFNEISHILDSTSKKYVKETGKLVIDRKTLSAKFTKKYEVLTDKNQIPAYAYTYTDRIVNKRPKDQSYELKCKYHQSKINIIDYQGDMRLPSPF